MHPSSAATSAKRTIAVVPCFNEARRLDVRAYAEFLSAYPDVGLLFVDDGSTDDTPLVVERLRQQQPLQTFTLQLAENGGKAEAVRRGMLAALRRGAEFVGYWDADLATPLDAIPKFVELLRAKPELRLVMGSRVALLGRQIRRSTWRHVLGRTFATAASVVLGLPVYDTQCGAKLFRVAPETVALFQKPFRARWVFDVEILARMVAAAAADGETVSRRIYEYPLEQWRDVGGSRLKARDFVGAAVDLGRVYRDTRRARPPAEGAAGRTSQPDRIGRREAA